MAMNPDLTGYEPNVTDNFDEREVTASIFHSSSVKSKMKLAITVWRPQTEIDDEHIRNQVASPLYIQERAANASLMQAYHCTEESLLPGARSILAGTEKPVAWLSQKR